MDYERVRAHVLVEAGGKVQEEVRALKTALAGAHAEIDFLKGDSSESSSASEEEQEAGGGGSETR